MSGPGSLLVGGVLGLLLGTGLVLALGALPGVRQRDLAARIDPYLRRSPGSALLDAPSATSRGRVLLESMLGPIAQRVLGLLERLTGGAEQLEHRLRLAGRRTSVDSFRIEQVIAGVAGAVTGTVLALAAITLRGASPAMGLLIILLGALTGVLLRDHLLSREIARRASRMAREFPTVADLLALAVAAGESPLAAMERVARTSSGALPEEFAATVADIRAGAGISQALSALGARTPLHALSRFGDGVAIAIERGTPLAEVLRAQAQDARESAKRDLMETAGRREVVMLVPVVFLVLPMVIVFAIFPGLAVLEISL